MSAVDDDLARLRVLGCEYSRLAKEQRQRALARGRTEWDLVENPLPPTSVMVAIEREQYAIYDRYGCRPGELVTATLLIELVHNVVKAVVNGD